MFWDDGGVGEVAVRPATYTVRQYWSGAENIIGTMGVIDGAIGGWQDRYE
jgi:hypothetical protein